MVPETPGNTSPCAVSGSEHQRSRRGFPIGAGDIRSGGSPARPSVHAPRHRTADPHPVPSTGRQQNPASRPKSDDRRSRKEAPSARRFLISSPWSWVISSIGRSGCNPNPTGERPWPPSNPRGLRLSYARGSTQPALTSELHHVRGHYPGVIEILEGSGLGLPDYYSWRSRSGCTFCFFQQKIEWVRLQEQHPEAFEEAKRYEKTAIEHGSPFTWSQGESLTDLEKPERQEQIRLDHEKRLDRARTRMQANPLRPDTPLDGRVASITGQARSTLTRENGQPTDSNLAQPSSVILLRARTPICASVF